jgi:phage terminase large subunit-like protein
MATARECGVTEPAKSRAELAVILETLEAIDYRKKYRQFDYFEAYPKQKEFYALGRTKRERLLIAGNQNGKTHAGAFEATCHLTGEYPKDWKGRKFDKPTKGWIAGETSLVVRDVQQKKLCGEPGVDEMFGTGMIPKDAFADKPSLARGVTDAYDTIQVRHKSGGISVARFKSYEQGRTKFQGESIDWGWADEEPPEDVYAEFLTRTVATGGMMFMTFTPLKGRSSVVIRFLDEPSDDRGFIAMTIEDALHIPEAERAKIIAGFLPHEREARARGVPMLGSGRIFMMAEGAVAEPPIEYIPQHWTKLWGIDFGIGHPFAAVLSLWDRDNDVLHIHHCMRVSDALPIQHAHSMKQIGAAVPVAWPKDGADREKSSGEPLAAAYKKHALIMLPEHATWPDGGVSTEAGILEMDERMRSGRLKVAAHLSEWFEEYRFYHRKDGQIVKIKDDLMSATRICVMMKRMGRTVTLGSKVAARNADVIAAGTDFDVFTGA